MNFTYTLRRDSTIDELLKDDWRLGKKVRHTYRMNDVITIDGAVPFYGHVQQAGTVLTFRQELETTYEPIAHPIEVVYEDEHLLIVVKPAFVKTHPNESGEMNTLSHYVSHYVGGRYVEHVHRLDEETEGLVLFAKHPISKAILDDALQRRDIVRRYEAVVEGRWLRHRGTLRQPIGKDRHTNNKFVVTPKGKPSVTHFKTIRHDRHETVLELELETGRQHQIRVHVSHAGHPIVGDTLYGSTRQRTPYALRATTLQLAHPLTRELMHVTM